MGKMPAWIEGLQCDAWAEPDQGRVWWVPSDDGPTIRVNIVDWQPRYRPSSTFDEIIRVEAIGDFDIAAAEELYAQLGAAIVAAKEATDGD